MVKSFGTREYEFYAQDSFKWKRNLTLTYGLRYSNDRVPYERNGVQVLPRQDLSQFFAERVGGMPLGIPTSWLPSSTLTYELGGPVNGGKDWFPRDGNNWAPRLSVAWAPEGDNLFTKILGKGSVIRGGAAVVYDHYGTSMVNTFANSGSPGLASTVSQPLNTDFTTSFRYAGGSLPACLRPRPAASRTRPRPWSAASRR